MATDHVLNGTWVNVPGQGVAARDVLHFGPGKSFTAKIQKPGTPVLMVSGVYKVVAPQTQDRKKHVSQVVLLLIDAQTGSKLGMPVAEQRAIRRRRNHQALMSRFFYLPELPALTDMDKALFVRKGSEARVSQRYALMRKRLNF